MNFENLSKPSKILTQYNFLVPSKINPSKLSPPEVLHSFHFTLPLLSKPSPPLLNSQIEP
jgi:hypothetical protein